MSQIITKENFIDAKYDVFKKFHQQLAVITCGGIEDFRCMTIGWGAMGNVWGHPGATITVYVNPARYTFAYMQQKEYFTVCFFPEEYRRDVMTLGTKSGRDGDKVALTGLTPKALENGVGFEQAELTFVCKKLYGGQFELEKTPEQIRNSIYTKFEPHYFYIGSIEDAFGEVK